MDPVRFPKLLTRPRQGSASRVDHQVSTIGQGYWEYVADTGERFPLSDSLSTALFFGRRPSKGIFWAHAPTVTLSSTLAAS